MVRPKKSGHAKKQRLANHKKRLIELGLSEELIRTLTPKDMRGYLRTPVKTAAQFATS